MVPGIGNMVLIALQRGPGGFFVEAFVAQRARQPETRIVPSRSRLHLGQRIAYQRARRDERVEISGYLHDTFWAAISPHSSEKQPELFRQFSH
jgi:hypothetical protein